MKYIKISTFFISIIILFIYYKSNSDNNNSVFEDKLSMFIFIKSHKNIEDILLDLETQFESFDEYVYNVHYIKNNDFLIENKLKLNLDKNYLDYRQLLNSSNISDFNIRIGNLLEAYFLENNISLYQTKRYFLRNFLIRFYHYMNFQINLFHKNNNNLEKSTAIENFIIGPKHIYDYKDEYYMLRMEFIDSDAILNYQETGMDSIFNSILNYNSKTFNSELFLYNPNSIITDSMNFDFQLTQYVIEAQSLDEMISIHKNLILDDNVVRIESLYNYYFDNSYENNRYKLNMNSINTIPDIDYEDYRKSLLFLEEKLITLQTDDLYNDQIITKILSNLVGDGQNRGDYSKYIDSVDIDSNYIIQNINRLFTYELRQLYNQINHSEKKFNIHNLPLEVKKHLMTDDNFKIRYFIK